MADLLLDIFEGIKEWESRDSDPGPSEFPVLRCGFVHGNWKPPSLLEVDSSGDCLLLSPCVAQRDAVRIRDEGFARCVFEIGPQFSPAQFSGSSQEAANLYWLSLEVTNKEVKHEH